MSHRTTYQTDAVRVHWDSSRCIHTGICLRTLPSVFDVRRRPWVDLQGAEADAVADAVARCPTGALRYARLDGAEGERPQRPTLVWPIEDGPLLMVGDLELRGPDGDLITHETRLTLCRCGLSHNQPFCDNSHRRRKWTSGPSIEPPEPPPAPERHAVEQSTIVVDRRDASLEVRGELRIYHSDGRDMVDAGRVLLCRCGQSANKPFCDSSDEHVGFRSCSAETSRDRLEAETPAAFLANPRVPDPRTTTRGR
ncbi:MAG: CDGSH iron-sulfur domain-containing protein [Solirubrobacteraceae bacterium]|jgi:CDGSH-type Zn-finger protein/uncharacterized Fe-S cluster protein YjdI